MGAFDGERWKGRTIDGATKSRTRKSAERLGNIAALGPEVEAAPLFSLSHLCDVAEVRASSRVRAANLKKEPKAYL